jgi:hypothetical protein
VCYFYADYISKLEELILDSHVIAGNVIAKLGVKYLYIISFGVMTPLLIAIYFLVWETTYDRPPPQSPSFEFNRKDSEETSLQQSSLSKDGSIKNSLLDDLKKGGTLEMIEDTRDIPIPEELSPYLPPTEGTPEDPKHTLCHNLKIYRGRVTDRSLIKAFFQPFPFMVFPAVIFSTVVNGAFITWSMISGIISHQVLLYPPYNLQPDTLAYLSLPASVVGLIFSVTAGLFSDKMIQWMAHRNNGIYEPEYRLILMVPAVVFSTIGFFLLGPLYENHASVVKLVLTGLMFHISGPFASSACMTYIFDTLHNSSTEAFVAASLFKHIFVFFATSYVPSWFAKVGPISVYRTLVILNLSFAALTIPMYVFGKRLRGAVRILFQISRGSIFQDIRLNNNRCRGTRCSWLLLELPLERTVQHPRGSYQTGIERYFQ